ncbi:MAG: citrate lyase acyl carrier protein [Marinifilaceae bacterium]|jgi:citrate lyase subunit gamma (acyl carrier protein)|nr:citrate lyase acyl carrier protein [Marinilabiliaceae bacterium JC040]MCT4600561.1 citrate lyase acyl carrier protein [Marinifilaceae bacterium]
MKIINKAQAGSFESSDILVMVEPSDAKGRNIEFSSTVGIQYGESILAEIHSVLDEMNVEDVQMIVNDKGALVPTIRARVETAITRGRGEQKGTLA